MPVIAFVDLLILAVAFAVVCLVGTQIVIPLATNRPAFPMFRKREKTRELQEANDELDDLQIERKIRDAQSKAETMRAPAPVVSIHETDQAGESGEQKETR